MTTRKVTKMVMRDSSMTVGEVHSLLSPAEEGLEAREIDSFARPERTERSALALDEHQVTGSEGRGDNAFTGGADSAHDFAAVLA
ncbi:hypothetical protein BN874_60015 [Candidatus Contendobacter odensis Run_B_J11]|uniref:Uncharacterized protein n=1 Tax=Candidatus Contendobacter odensis Run_B_J11 TaxID=1400861 RepID=A0A7U7GET2_9GAMM|nr:hypothetical protein BN874_60015 [Candidatus Contendobacter odensis Run_B_J11]